MKVNGDASIDKKFQEALIYNGVISEEEVIKLCNTYDRISLKAHVPDEIVKTVKFLSLPSIPRSTRLFQLLGFWKGPRDPFVASKSSKKRVVEKDGA